MKELLRVFGPDMPPQVTGKAECFIAVWTPVRISLVESIDMIVEVMLLSEALDTIMTTERFLLGVSYHVTLEL